MDDLPPSLGSDLRRLFTELRAAADVGLAALGSLENEVSADRAALDDASRTIHKLAAEISAVQDGEERA